MSLSERIRNACGRRYRSVVLCTLILIYILNMVDRQLVAVLSPAIKQELDFSDTQLGLLKGFAFIFIYSFMGLPLAHLADRYSRVNIIFASLATWSGFTLLAGYAQSFTQLVLARFGFGIGAAGCTPPAHSLLADYFSGGQRSTVISFYMLSLPLAHSVTFVMGGWFNVHWGWRNTLLFFGCTGLLLVVLRLVIHEPRRPNQKKQTVSIPHTSMTSGLKTLIVIPSFRRISIAAGLGACGVSGLTAWIIDFLYRSTEIDYQLISTIAGLAYGLSGTAGMLMGSFLTNKLGRKHARFYLKTPGLALLICVPCLLLALWSDQIYLTLSMFSIVILLMYSFQGTVFSLIPAIVAAHLRSRASALMLFVMNMLGAGLGPLLVGAVSDSLAGTMTEDNALCWGISTSALAFFLAGLLFINASGRLHFDIR